MKCDEKWLDERLMNLLKERQAVPLPVVERILTEESSRRKMECSLESIKKTIQKALDSWKIDKAIDYLDDDTAKELNQDPFLPVWYLTMLSSERSQMFQNLKPAEQELVRMLRQANTRSEQLGQIPRCVAIEILKERGYDVGLDHIWVADTIKEYMSHYAGVLVWWWGLLTEDEKSEEFKRAEDEMIRRRIVKDESLSRLDDRPTNEEDE
jgi:hypothetical protein